MTNLISPIREGDFTFSCEMALLGPFTHVPEVLAHRRLAGPSRSSIPPQGTRGQKTMVAVRPAWLSILHLTRVSRPLETAAPDSAWWAACSASQRASTPTASGAARGDWPRGASRSCGARARSPRDERRTEMGRTSSLSRARRASCPPASRTGRRRTTGSRMGEGHPPAAERHADLSSVQMAGEDQIERPGGHPLGDPGIVAEQHCEGCLGVRSSCGATCEPGSSRDRGPRCRCVPLRSPASRRRREGAPRRPGPAARRPARRIVRNGDIVVPEHDVRSVEGGEKPPQPILAPRMRHEVAGHADDVRLPLHDPGDGPFSRAIPRESLAPRWKSERCPSLRPSSVSGRSGIATSRTRVRSQPASNQP